MGMLTQAAAMLKQGRVTEQQLETLLLRQLQVSKCIVIVMVFITFSCLLYSGR